MQIGDSRERTVNYWKEKGEWVKDLETELLYTLTTRPFASTI